MELKPWKEISEAKRVVGSEKMEGSVEERHSEIVGLMSYVFG